MTPEKNRCALCDSDTDEMRYDDQLCEWFCVDECFDCVMRGTE